MVMRRGIEALSFSIGKLLKFIEFTRALRINVLLVFSWQPEKKNVWRL